MAALHHKITPAKDFGVGVGRGGQTAATLRDPRGCGQLSASNYFLQEIGERVLCSFVCKLAKSREVGAANQQVSTWKN